LSVRSMHVEKPLIQEMYSRLGLMVVAEEFKGNVARTDPTWVALIRVIWRETYRQRGYLLQ
jgi:hypothetical protein